MAAAPIRSISLDSLLADTGAMDSDRFATDFLCFADGTRIATPFGEISVEQLEVGDLVDTLDHGAQPIRWIRYRLHLWDKTPHKQKPIKTAAGTLGAGLPLRDLRVSPQHRVLVPCSEHPEGALLAAKALTHLPGLRQMKGARRVSYTHLLFDRHEVVFAEGVPCESFFPGPTGLRSLSMLERIGSRQSVLRDASTGALCGYAPARPFLKPGQSRHAIARPVWTDRLLAYARVPCTAPSRLPAQTKAS